MSPPQRPRRKRSGEFLSEDLAHHLSRPQTQAEFDALFDDDASCRRYLAALRWPNGFICPHCHQRAHAETSDRALLRCVSCRFVCTPTTGTSLEQSPLPLKVWMRTIWELVSHESGANMVRLRAALPSRDLRLTRDWLDAVQMIFDKIWRVPLRGLVEVAKVPIEVVTKGDNGRARSRHSMVAIAVEAHRNNEPGAIRIRSLPRVDSSSMLGFVRNAVAQDSCVRTCRWQGYANLRHHGYGHIITRQPVSDERSMAVVQQVASILRLWLWSTNAVEIDRIDYYLSEFTFRYNARIHYAASNRAALFKDILRLAVEADGIPRAVPRQASG